MKIKAWPFLIAAGLALPAGFIAYKSEALLIVVVLLIAVWAAWKGRVTLRPLPWGLFLPYAALVLWGAASSVWGIPEVDSLKATVHLAPLLLAAPLLVVLMSRLEPSEDTVRRSALVYGLGLALLLGLMIADLMTEGQVRVALAMIGRGSVTAETLKTSNPATTVAALFALPGMLLVRRSFGPVLGGVALGVSILTILLSDSLSAQIGLIGALIAAALVLAAGKRGVFIAGVAAILIVLFLPAVKFAGDAPFMSIRKSFTALSKGEIKLPVSVLHRIYIYDFTLDRISERPYTGWGMGASPKLKGGGEIIPEINRIYLPLHPHNLVLQVWVELGLIGAVIFSFIVWSIFSQITRHAAGGVMAAMTGSAIAYFVISLTAYKAWASWWIASGILVAAVLTPLLRASPPQSGRLHDFASSSSHD